MILKLVGIFRHSLLLMLLAAMVSQCSRTERSAVPESAADIDAQSSGENSQALDGCVFPGLMLPENYSVFSVGGYSGRELNVQIDSSGHMATQIDVKLSSSEPKPVALVLGAYEPTIWNIEWTNSVQILAIVANGYHDQKIAGANASTSMLISTFDNGNPCGFRYRSRSLQSDLNGLSELIFDDPVRTHFDVGRDGVVRIRDGVIDDPVFVTDIANTPASYFLGQGQLAGLPALEYAVIQGQIRPATEEDAQRWFDLAIASADSGDVAPIIRPQLYNAYVILKEYTFPSGLTGGNRATFFIPESIEVPEGDPGHSIIYNFNTMECSGALCIL